MNRKLLNERKIDLQKSAILADMRAENPISQRVLIKKHKFQMKSILRAVKRWGAESDLEAYLAKRKTADYFRDRAGREKRNAAAVESRNSGPEYTPNILLRSAWVVTL